jgi:hypothetical protein
MEKCLQFKKIISYLKTRISTLYAYINMYIHTHTKLQRVVQTIVIVAEVCKLSINRYLTQSFASSVQSCVEVIRTTMINNPTLLFLPLELPAPSSSISSLIAVEIVSTEITPVCY